MNVKIEKMDDFGRGIAYIDDKVVFVPKTIVDDIVNIKIMSEKKKYSIAKVNEIINPSKLRIPFKCPYFEICGGCSLQNVEYRIELEYKLQKINNLLKKNRINYQVKDIIKSAKRYNYRNKVSLKIEDNIIGYYEKDTHNIVEINKCFLLNDAINDVIDDLPRLSIINGSVIIRSNLKGELLLIIYTDKLNKDGIKYLVNKHRISGIVLNDKCIFGSDFLVDKIDDYKFKISYNSFFQVNPYICKELFKIVKDYTKDANNLIDLYSGVGTLSIVAKENASSVLGVEIIDNAAINAKTNAMLNGVSNISFIASDTNKIISYLEGKDFVIVDPPRSGLTSKVIEGIKKYQVKNILYVSCDPNTLMRDLNLLLTDYKIIEFKLLDMFPNTYHVESVCVLEHKN